MLKIDDLIALGHLVKLTPLIESAGVHPKQWATLARRRQMGMSGGRELTESEAAAITEELKKLRDEITRAIR